MHNVRRFSVDMWIKKRAGIAEGIKFWRRKPARPSAKLSAPGFGFFAESMA
jgi:hypothetical protein